MSSDPGLSPTAVVSAAARRLMEFAKTLHEAQEQHGIGPGPHDDLSSPEFLAAASEVFRETLGDDYLLRLGLTFGAVASLMDLVSERAPGSTSSDQWEVVRRYFEVAAQSLTPGFRDRLVELDSLAEATRRTPAIVRFDLLAALASRAGVARLFDAAAWVSEVASGLPPFEDAEMDTTALAALAARQLDRWPGAQ